MIKVPSRLPITRIGAVVLTLFQCYLGDSAMGQSEVYKDPKASLEDRVDALFQKLTDEEKLNLLTGTGFTTSPIPRLGIPPMQMVDAGEGVRGGASETLGPATAFPAAVAMASTWDFALVKQIGEAIGEETLNKGNGSQVLLGPAINIHRSPLGGRNGEYFSEDPYLAGRLAVAYIEGLQSTGAAACLKHFAVYNQENRRYTIDARLSERALREIYLSAFEMAVKEAHPWTVMSSYNQINGFKATSNAYLMLDVLKKGWGFDGVLMSDWGGVQDTVGPLNAGNDLEMPGREYMTPERVSTALRAGKVSQAAIDDSVRRILRTILRVGLMDGSRKLDPSRVNSEEHRRLSLQAAVEGIVLLKNEDGVLPLENGKVRSIAIIGAAARDFQIACAGSPKVVPLHSVSPLEGIRKRAGQTIKVVYSTGAEDGSPVPESVLVPPSGKGSGLLAEYFGNRNLEGKPAMVRTDPQIQFEWTDGPPVPGMDQGNFSVRWQGILIPKRSGKFKLSLTADDGCRLFLDDKPLIDHWVDSAATPNLAEVDLQAGHRYKLRVEYFQSGGEAVARLGWGPAGEQRAFAEAVDVASKSDTALVFVATRGTEGEAADRPSMSLPRNQDALIKAVAAANKRTVVILNNGTPVQMTGWIEDVAGVVELWFPGQEGGTALAAILFGDVSPSGKLPTTFGVRREDYPDFGNFPGNNGRVNYAEGIYVGYRHFDKKRIEPLFPFGHGLSYTLFRYTNLRVSSPRLPADGSVQLAVDVTNIGQRSGAEIAQLYISDTKPLIDKPTQELRGFQRLELRPGETKTAVFEVKPRALAYCDVAGKQWRADAGTYEMAVGSSSRDLHLKTSLALEKTFTETIPFLEEQHPPLPEEGEDLALDCSTTSSSEAHDSEYGSEASRATDDNRSTYWRSDSSDPQWLMVDLGKEAPIRRANIQWGEDRFGPAHAKSYSFQVSVDGVNWTDVYQNENGLGGLEKITFDPVTAHWVRLLCKKRASERGDTVVSLQVFN
jgi:beta-glucosidase